MFRKKMHSFSPDGNFLAICEPNGMLRIWNTNNNTLEHEFQPSEHLSATTTCLSYSKNVRKRKQSKKKKKNPEEVNSESSNYLVAMGTVAGTIFIYNPALQELLTTLEHSSMASILDVEWETDTTLVTLASDGSLVYWDAIKAKKLRSQKVGKNSSLCLLAKNQVVVASMGIKLLNFDSESTNAHKFTGHKNQVTHLVSIHMENEMASHFLSAAEDERYIYAWSASCESHDPIAAFSINDTIRSISCMKVDDTSVGIVVITKKGILQYFSHHLNGVKRVKPIKNRHSLRIALEGATEEHTLPIIAAHFVSKDVLLFTYGSELFLRSEKMSIINIKEKKTLKRSDPSLFPHKKESKLLNTVTPHISNEVVHLTPSYFSKQEEASGSSKRKRGDTTLHMPMEERLNALSIKKPLSVHKGPLVSDNVHLLMQGLHSKDSKLLYSVLMKGENEEVVNNTIKNLPVQYAVPLLNSLQEFLMTKGLRNLAIINWIKSLLIHHMSHLSTLPNKHAILDPFYTLSSARMTTLPEVTKLHSRLNLLLTHVTSRHDNSTKKQTEQDPLLLYRDDSDEEQDNRMETTALFSESEDFADTWSEDDMEDDGEETKNLAAESNGISGSDETQDSSRLALCKTKGRSRSASDASLGDDSLVISDSEEEEEENSENGPDDSKDGELDEQMDFNPPANFDTMVDEDSELFSD